MIRGIVTSGSYKDCVVDILNEGSSNSLGKIFIESYKDICKYNVRIFLKPFNSEGKKKIGETTYLNKESVSLQLNCSCKDTGCILSHLPFPAHHLPFPAQVPSLHSQVPSPQSRAQLIEILATKYANHKGVDSIMSIRISHETMKQYGGSEHVNAFVRMACLCIRVLVEQYCKDVTSTNLQARDLVSLVGQRGIVNAEKEKELSDILGFTNIAIHSCYIGNPPFFLQKIDKALATLATL
jgi:hypothetical protein